MIWIKRHKVWTGIIIYICMVTVFGAFGVDAFLIGQITGLVGFVLLIAWLLTRKRDKKDGTTE